MGAVDGECKRLNKELSCGRGDSSPSPCPLMASGNKPALWLGTGCDIYSHFHRSWVGSHTNATWEFLGVISSWLQPLNKMHSRKHEVSVVLWLLSLLFLGSFSRCQNAHIRTAHHFSVCICTESGDTWRIRINMLIWCTWIRFGHVK